MNLKDLIQSGRIIFECVSGSHAYGLSTPKSDIDIRGIYVNPPTEYLGLLDASKQISDEKNDTTYYSLRRIFELLQTANPNIIEMLWMPEDCIKINSSIMEKIITNRGLFISKKCYHSHSGYAYAQIKKAKGQNKKVHNPMPEEMPKKEDFCRIIPSFAMDTEFLREESLKQNVPLCPCRPLSLPNCVAKDGGFFDLRLFHVSALEHVSDTYRLYMYGEEAKGVFRGDDMLVCESIPIDDELDKFAGLLIYNKHEYDKALKDWHSYWDWMKNRNEHRWIDQEKGKLNYDQKNMTHCMRLLMSGENILSCGHPIVRFEGEQLEYLRNIRAGNFEYEEIMAEVDSRMETLEKLYETSKIPHSVNVKKIDELYRELTGGVK